MQPVASGDHSETELIVRPGRFRARAWWRGELVADSGSVLELRAPGERPALYFPAADVHFEVLDEQEPPVSCPVKGPVTLFDLAGESAPPAGWSARDRPERIDGRGAAWTPRNPPVAVAGLRDMICFDHDRVRVEILDPMGSDEPRDLSVKRHPVWGDAEDLIDLLRVRPVGERRYESAASPDSDRPVVEGSQLLGQAIAAAGLHAPGRRVVSSHMAFFRAADARLPLSFELAEHSSGRTFTTLGVRVVQDGRPRAAGTLLLDATAPDLVRHAVAAPPAAGPYDSVPHDMSVTGRDLRVVDGAYTDDPAAPVGPPVIDAWVRFRAPLDDDPALHAALLAQFTGHMSIAAALRPHEGVGQAQAHRTISTGINAIALSLHRDVRADRWMRYHHHSTFAGDGMTHAECRVHDERGELLASFTVDAMVRGFGGSPHEGRAATAI